MTRKLKECKKLDCTTRLSKEDKTDLIRNILVQDMGIKQNEFDIDKYIEFILDVQEYELWGYYGVHSKNLLMHLNCDMASPFRKSKKNDLQKCISQAEEYFSSKTWQELTKKEIKEITIIRIASRRFGYRIGEEISSKKMKDRLSEEDIKEIKKTEMDIMKKEIRDEENKIRKQYGLQYKRERMCEAQ